MILVTYKINLSIIIYILIYKLFNLNKKKNIKIYSVLKNDLLDRFLRVNNLNWKIIEINESELNKLIEINYIKTNQIIDEIFIETKLNDYLSKYISDPRIQIYLKKAIYSDNLPGIDFNIKKLLIILDVLKYKFEKKEIVFVINNFKYLNFFKKKYLNKKIDIVGIFNLNLFIYDIKNFFLIFTTKIISKYFSIFFKENNYNSLKDFKKIVIDSPFELIDENNFFHDKDFIYTSYHHPISINSQKNLKKNNLTFRAINIKNNNKNNFKKNLKKEFLKTFLEFRAVNINFSSNYINRLLIIYFIEKKIWLDFFRNNKSRIYYTNYKWNRHVEPASSAIENLGGLSLLSYHSFYEFVTYSSVVSTDILLSFNDNFEEIERKAGSIHKINLPAGYPKILSNNSEKKINEIKQYFLEKKVEKIILFLDQGNTNDEKYDLGSTESCKGYKTMFDIVIQFPNVGLIIKPKKPKYILDKIKKIGNYQEAISSERIYIEQDYTENNAKNLKMPPHLPAMISDLVIHDHLVAATAGIDAYLSCKRVIYFDHYKFQKFSIFDKFRNKENIIFNDWEILKKSVGSFIKDKNANLGKWNQNDFNKIIDGKETSLFIKKLLLEINKSFINEKSKNEILTKIKLNKNNYLDNL